MATLLEDLQDLVSLLPADQSAELRKIIENPASQKFAQELKDGRLRLSDYSRFMNENKGKIKYADEMKEWADKNVPKHEKMVKDFSELKTSKRTLEQQVTEYRDQLAKVQSGEMNVDEATLNARIETRVKDLGYVNRADMETIARQEATKLAREEANTAVTERTNKFLTETWPAATEIMSTLVECSFAHMDEFKKPLTRDDRKAIGELMRERNIQDPQKAYDEWVSPKRTEARITADVEKRVSDELSKRVGFPGVTGIPASELGPMQAKQAGTLPELPDGVIGDNTAAMAAAKEFHAEGKF